MKNDKMIVRRQTCCCCRTAALALAASMRVFSVSHTGLSFGAACFDSTASLSPSMFIVTSFSVYPYTWLRLASPLHVPLSDGCLLPCDLINTDNNCYYTNVYLFMNLHQIWGKIHLQVFTFLNYFISCLPGS